MTNKEKFENLKTEFEARIILELENSKIIRQLKNYISDCREKEKGLSFFELAEKGYDTRKEEEKLSEYIKDRSDWEDEYRKRLEDFEYSVFCDEKNSFFYKEVEKFCRSAYVNPRLSDEE